MTLSEQLDNLYWLTDGHSREWCCCPHCEQLRDLEKKIEEIEDGA